MIRHVLHSIVLIPLALSPISCSGKSGSPASTVHESKRGGSAKKSYECQGVDSESPEKQKVTLNLEVTSEGVNLVDEDGDEQTIERGTRRNEDRYAYAVYINNEVDGYGGFVKISVPKAVARGEHERGKSFVAYYTRAIYSELGKVGAVRVKATCK